MSTARIVNTAEGSARIVETEVECLWVEFDGKPPLSRYSTDYGTEDGTPSPLVRLHESAGRFKVMLLPDGSLEVRVDGAMIVSPNGAGSIRIEHRSDERRDDEVVYEGKVQRITPELGTTR